MAMPRNQIRLFSLPDLFSPTSSEDIERMRRDFMASPFSSAKKTVINAYYAYWETKLGHTNFRGTVHLMMTVQEKAALIKQMHLLIKMRDDEFLFGVRDLANGLPPNSTLPEMLIRAVNQATVELEARRTKAGQWVLAAVACYALYEVVTDPKQLLAEAGLLFAAEITFNFGKIARHLVNEVVEIINTTDIEERRDAQGVTHTYITSTHPAMTPRRN